MSTTRHTVLLLTNVIVIMMNFNSIDGIGKSNECVDLEYSPLCFCRSSYRRSTSTNLFLATLSLFQCTGSLPIRHCRQSRLHPPSFHLTQLIPQLTNLSHCLEDIQCLHTLHSIQYCRRCRLTHDDSHHTNTCFNFCEQKPSCGVICLNQRVIISMHCNICQGRRQNVSCRCIKPLPSSLPSSCKTTTTTTPRWMQKRGFPAAGILALIILAVALLVITIKLIYRQLDILDRRQSLSIDQSILPCQSRQRSASYYNISRIIHGQSQQLIVEIDRW